jgi:hypothetical protein
MFAMLRRDLTFFRHFTDRADILVITFCATRMCPTDNLPIPTGVCQAPDPTTPPDQRAERKVG